MRKGSRRFHSQLPAGVVYGCCWTALSLEAKLSTREWLVRDRVIAYPGRLLVLAAGFGPPISALVVMGPLFFGSLPSTAFSPVNLAFNVIMFCIGSYVMGLLPALVAAMILILRRNITVLEALVVTFGASFAAGTLYGISSGSSATPIYTGASLALIAAPGAIGVGLLAVRCGVFATRQATGPAPFVGGPLP